MPIDIQHNTDLPKSYVLSSETIELIGAAHLLAEPTHHEFAKEWVELVRKDLSQDSIEFLKVITTLPLNGMGLYSLLISKREFNDVDSFLERIVQTDDHQFLMEIYEIEEDRVLKIKSSTEELLKYIEDNYLVAEECQEGIEYTFFHTATFRRNLRKLFEEIYTDHFKYKMKALEELYAHSIESINNQLAIKKPLDVAQELMGKTFYRVFPFKEFIFVPSYFISPHRLRTFTKEVQLLIYDVRRDCLYLNEVGEKITNTLKVLSDRTRLEIVRQLLMGPTYGKVLAGRLDLTTATISHHLEQLRTVDILIEEKVKNTKYFSVNKENLEKLLSQTNDYLHNKL